MKTEHGRQSEETLLNTALEYEVDREGLCGAKILIWYKMWSMKKNLHLCFIHSEWNGYSVLHLFPLQILGYRHIPYVSLLFPNNDLKECFNITCLYSSVLAISSEEWEMPQDSELIFLFYFAFSRQGFTVLRTTHKFSHFFFTLHLLWTLDIRYCLVHIEWGDLTGGKHAG